MKNTRSACMHTHPRTTPPCTTAQAQGMPPGSAPPPRPSTPTSGPPPRRARCPACLQCGMPAGTGAWPPACAAAGKRAGRGARRHWAKRCGSTRSRRRGAHGGPGSATGNLQRRYCRGCASAGREAPAERCGPPARAAARGNGRGTARGPHLDTSTGSVRASSCGMVSGTPTAGSRAALSTRSLRAASRIASGGKEGGRKGRPSAAARISARWRGTLSWRPGGGGGVG